MADNRWDEETVVVSSDSRLDEGAGRERAYLIVLSGSRMGAMVEIKSGLIVGRSHGADFQVLDDGISRQHMRVKATVDGRLIVEDLGSRNGTYVNGERTTSTVLQDGDKIRIGTTTILKFSYADKLEESFQQYMREAALRDPLTGAYNRRYFDEQLEREVAYAQRHGSTLSLIFMDLDHFKQINDTHGHLTGDKVLIALVELIGQGIRKEDFLARYGGEEFALLCRDTPGPVAFGIAQRLRTAIAAQPLITDPASLTITISAGVACLPHPEIGSAKDLIGAADKALYQAKDSGRNRVCVWVPADRGGGPATPPVPPAPEGASR